MRAESEIAERESGGLAQEDSEDPIGWGFVVALVGFLLYFCFCAP